VFWRRGKAPADFGLLVLGALTAAWFAWRAWTSPVKELGQADLMLAAGAVGAFLSVRSIAGNVLAEKILSWGIALLLLTSMWVIGKQVVDPTFTPVFRARASETMVSGFFAHYNYAANYLIASSMLVGAAALFGRHAIPSRIVLGLISIMGLAGVWFTISRGGILGAAVACGVFGAILLILGWRKNARWFSPAVLAIPVIGLGIGAFLFMGWQNSQEIRNAGSGLDALMDNTIRLYLLGIAMSCLGQHPLAGGGSQSFSWECFRFWERMKQSSGGAKPEMVHNELMQSATDYGLVGAGLLIGLIGTLVLSAILRILFENRSKEPDHRDAWRIGALAALAGILVQSCFSFVFHLMPGVILLGICLGQISRSTEQPPCPRTVGNRVLLSLTAIACVFLLLPVGWKGTRTTRILWSTYFGKQSFNSVESRIDALSEAITIWPRSTLYQERASLFQSLADPKESLSFKDYALRAVDDYEMASRLHPFDPGPEVNRANLLSQLQHDAEAEAAYSRAISLQGAMEAGFRGNFSLANHLFGKGLRQFDPESPGVSVKTLEGAANHMEQAVNDTPPWVINVDGRNTRIAIYESLGAAREADGDYEGALESYDFAAAVHTGSRAHYRAGVLFGKMATTSWAARKPAEAMGYFIEAKRRIGLASELPQGLTPEQRAEYVAYLDKTIAYLKGAKIEPIDPKNPRIKE